VQQLISLVLDLLFQSEEAIVVSAAEQALTHHAVMRMRQRGLRAQAIEAALAYGRVVYKHGAVVHILGKREVRLLSTRGLNLSDFVNLHVVCGHDGSVLTVYRNEDLKSIHAN